MTAQPRIYCLDTNVLIEAWNKYYSPVFFPSYWDVLNELGAQGRIVIPAVVKEEISRGDDDLFQWVDNSAIGILSIDGRVTQALRQLYEANPLHSTLVDNTRQRSLADPWVIAHAMVSGTCVVTKEELVTAANARRLKIPNVCENMGVTWINDFQMISELGIQFSCSKP